MTSPEDRRAIRPRGTVLVFVRAPVPGRVKTRLARSIGDGPAARLYATLARGILDRVRRGPWRTVVCFEPADQQLEIAAWLGTDGDVLPQRDGDLGQRMEAAARWAHPDRAGVCLVGSDIPGLDAEVIRRAFEKLESADVILGPARDGGYYLLATRRHVPELFQGIPWSTDQVLERTERACGKLGLRVSYLEPLIDIDTAEDLVEYPDLVPAVRPSGD